MEIRRFGVGHRRPDGPAGSHGVEGQVIHADGRGIVSEVAFARKASIESHTNPNTAWFVVIEGGGFVQVGDDVTRVAAGEAVLWPAGAVHRAWTDLSEMRAIVVEFAGPDDAHVRGILEGRIRLGEGGAADPAAGPPASPGDGRLAPRPIRGPDDYDRSSGEPY
jgi:quercetin dioxygenase-like cupin family protein